MIGTVPEMLVCPLCRRKLSLCSRTLRCPDGHCYDMAASGYVNLLPPGKMNNARTGDDKDMLRSRSRFLERGYYSAISETAALLLDLDQRNKNAKTVFVDAGSGEGWHTANIAATLEKAGADCIGIGFEASKNGANLAGRRALKTGNSRLFFAAANIFSMPVSDSCIDAVFSMFAPIPGQEAYRILKPASPLIAVSAGSKHLWEMRSILYGEPRESDKKLPCPAGFELSKEKSLEYNITVQADDIKDLFTMTPFYYRCPSDGRERLLGMTEPLKTRVCVNYSVFIKK